MTQTWEIWFPDAGATGLLFTRTDVDADEAGERVLVHAAAPKLDVIVRDESGGVTAEAKGLERDDGGPMTYLVRKGAEIRLEEGWPTDDDLGRLVLLAGGETGKLTAWWHADDKSEWRWSIELYNHV